jgi:DNA repair protein RecO (recombination protein O)
MQTRTEGIVLRTFPFSEADLLVTYITPDLGVRKAFAKSARKVKSRFGSSLEPLTHARITFLGKEDAELPRLIQSDILRPHQGLRETLQCFSLASEMAEVTLGLLPPGKESQKAFMLFKEMLTRMEEDCVPLGALLYKIRLLALKGYAPRLSDCGVCGKGATRFHVSHGTVMCDGCAKAQGGADRQERSNGAVITISQGGIRLYESLSTWELEKTARIKPSAVLLAEVGGLIDAHLEYLIAKPLKSRVFAAKTS